MRVNESSAAMAGPGNRAASATCAKALSTPSELGASARAVRNPSGAAREEDFAEKIPRIRELRPGPEHRAQLDDRVIGQPGKVEDGCQRLAGFDIRRVPVHFGAERLLRFRELSLLEINEAERAVRV